jgi:inner membrane protein
MMKRSHALFGGSLGAVVFHLAGEAPLAGAVVGGLAGLLPDVDHPTATVGQLLPTWWHRLTPGHRGPTHSIAWCAAAAVLVYLVHGWAEGGRPPPWLALGVLVGTLSHVLADALTVQGVPLWWPWSRRKVVLVGFRTGGIVEALTVIVVMLGAGWVLGQ